MKQLINDIIKTLKAPIDYSEAFPSKMTIMFIVVIIIASIVKLYQVL